MSHHRVALTEEEAIVWSCLRELRKDGLAFRRQVRIGPFTVDFLCRKAKLVIEIDGDHHGHDDRQWDHDRERDAWLRRQGYEIIRIWNADIRGDLNAVMDQIRLTAKSRT